MRGGSRGGPRSRGGPPARGSGLPRGAPRGHSGRGALRGAPGRGMRGGANRGMSGPMLKRKADFNSEEYGGQKRKFGDGWGTQPIAQQPLGTNNYYTDDYGGQEWYSDSYGQQWN